VLTIAVLSGPWPRLGVIVAALLAGAAILSRSDVRRAWTMLGAMVLAPVLLLDDVWHASQFSFVHRHPAEAAAGALVALAVLGVAAFVIHRRPLLVPLLTMITLPFRVPIATGGSAANGLVQRTTSNLLVPLYLVVAAAALAWIVPTLIAHRAAGSRTAASRTAASRTAASRAAGGGGGAQATQRPPRHWFERLLCAYIVVYAVQALYSTDFEKALQNEVFFYVPFAVLFALLRDIEWNRELLVRCLGLTAVLAVIFALIGFGEEITQTLWLNSKLIEQNQLHEYFTVNSVFFDPNIFGRYLALVMVLLVTVLLYDERPRAQIASILTLAILWGCLIFTLSRSSLAALSLGMAVLAALRWRAKPVLYLGAVVIVVGALAVATHPKTFGLNQGLNGASDGRASLVSGGITLFGDHPLQGWGSGSFSREYEKHFPISARAVSDSHNIPVTIASEQGLIGLALYVALVIAAIVTLLRGARGDPFRVGIIAVFLALLLHTMLYAAFLEDPVTWTLLGIGGALATAARPAEVEPAPDGGGRQRLGVGV
jgi:putative inorganic carbon (HCO3(-)) transporter